MDSKLRKELSPGSSSPSLDGSSSPQALGKDVHNDYQLKQELERLHELHRQVNAQEQKLQSLRQQAANATGGLDLMTAEHGVMKSLIFAKEKELAMALMKVAELTSQLEQLRRSHDTNDSAKAPQRRITCCNVAKTTPADEGVHREKVIPTSVVKENASQNHGIKKRPLLLQNPDEGPGIRVIPIVIEKTGSIPVATSVEGAPPRYPSSIRNEKISLIQSPDPDWTLVDKASCLPNGDSSRKIIKVDLKIAADSTAIGKTKKDDENCLNTSVNNNVIVPFIPGSYMDNGRAKTVSATQKSSDVSRSNSAVSDYKAPNRVIEIKRAHSEKIEKGGVGVTTVKRCDGDRSERKSFPDVRGGDVTDDVMVGTKKVPVKEVAIGTKKVCDDAQSFSNKLKDAEGMMNIISISTIALEKSEKHTSNKEVSEDENKFKKVDSSEREISPTSFSQEKKSLSMQLRRSLSESPSTGSSVAGTSPTRAGVVSDSSVESALTSKQSQPMIDSRKSYENQRARFFMDMVKEDETPVGNGQPLFSTPKSQMSSEYRQPLSPVMSSSMARGRSSSSAIMSRFAPQPYGRSKSVDSGNLRVSMSPADRTVFHDKSPDGMVEEARASSPLSSAFPVTTRLYSPMQSISVSPTPGSAVHIQGEMSFTDTMTRLDENSFWSSASTHHTRTVSLPLSYPLMKTGGSVPDRKTLPPTSVVERNEASKQSTNVTVGVSDQKSLPSDGKYSIPITSEIDSWSKDVPAKGLASEKSAFSLAGSVKIIPAVSIPMGVNAAAKLTDSPKTGVSPTARISLNNLMSPEVRSEKTNDVAELRKPKVSVSDSLVGEVFPEISTKAGSLSTPSDVKCDDMQSSDDVGNSRWDSNVKRLAHIYAVTIGGSAASAKCKMGLRGDGRHEMSENVSGVENSSKLTPYVDVPKKGSTSSKADYLMRQHAEEYFSTVSSPVLPAMKISNGAGLSKKLASSDLGSSSSLTPGIQHSLNTTDTEVYHGQQLSDAEVLEQSKIDTSADSVSTALSVLLKNNSSPRSCPMRPNRLRTTISYRRKLGTEAMDSYSQNMTLLYGDCAAKKDDASGDRSSTSSNLNGQVSSADSFISPPPPLIDDLPRILALDTLDGMPIYPRITSHLIGHDAKHTADGVKKEKRSGSDEHLRTGNVEMTVIPAAVQTARLIHVDSADSRLQSLQSFNPLDNLVSTYIDDPASPDNFRCSSDAATHVSVRHGLTRKNGKPRYRVTFDDVALLLNAALEGEKDIVVSVINKSRNPNPKTENGLSPLHNAVCGNHLDVVKYLVDFGCDINAADNDGWTPLHCAASSNNLEIMRILVENGASILPMTVVDNEIPLQKCSRSLPGYEDAVRYFSDITSSLGVANDGLVYITSNFTNVCSDELILSDGDCLKILRRGDETETEWWWAKYGDLEGYVPQSLLALYSRVPTK